MPLNKVKQGSQMYDWITHTWNIIKGKCYHDCTYCYMKRFPQNQVRFDEKELKTDLGNGNFIFVGSSCDVFADDIPKEWILKLLRKCNENPKNKYLFQTKNPKRLQFFNLPKKSVVCTTIETNRIYGEFMRNCPSPQSRSYYMPLKNYITIEPIMNFDIKELVLLIKASSPIQVNIGADSGNNKLPEPPKEKIIELIKELEKFTKVKQKLNLKRLLK
jgi:DNA repair photolyase